MGHLNTVLFLTAQMVKALFINVATFPQRRRELSYPTVSIL